MKTGVTDILGSEYPIILGAMRFITFAKMAAAVSNSGGFGLIAASGMEDRGADQKEINAFADKLYHEGRDDSQNKLMAAGQIAGLVREILSIDELIRQMVEGATGLSSGLTAAVAS